MRYFLEISYLGRVIDPRVLAHGAKTISSSSGGVLEDAMIITFGQFAALGHILLHFVCFLSVFFTNYKNYNTSEIFERLIFSGFCTSDHIFSCLYHDL